jgi:hypothetical protein
MIMTTTTNTELLTIEQVKDLIKTYPSAFTVKKSIKSTLDYLKTIYPNVSSNTELLYLYINSLPEPPKCKCGCKLNWLYGIHKGYGECSDKKCTIRMERIRSKIKETNLDRYGVENPAQTKEVQDKMKSTMVERYGVENPGQSEEIRQRVIATNQERYGVENAVQTKEVQDKMKSTMVDRYGVENPGQSEEIKNKMKATNLERYGVEHTSQTIELQNKRKATNLERYGVEHATLLQETKDKTKATNLERYGVEYVAQSKEIRKKVKTTNLERYGVEYIVQSEEIKEKQKHSSWINFYERFKDSLKYIPLDTSYRTQFGDIVKCKSCGTESEFHHVNGPMSWRCPHCEPITNGFSNAELEVLEFAQSIYDGDVIHGDRTVLNGKELDIYVPEKNFAIEFNGTYWHSADEESDKEMAVYHLNKTQGCESQGINLMHIWEHDWNDILKQKIIKSMIRSKLGLGKRVYARNTTVREVSTVVTKQFLSMNHLQGQSNSKVNLGLYHKGDLVALMTFGKPRFNKNYDWELIRYCSLLDINIVGGASKLLKHFRNNYVGSVLSYANREHSSGKLYESLGFKLINESQPNYQWYKGTQMLTRYQTQKHKLKEVLDEYFDSSMTESKNMFSNGYRRIWDCGNLVYELV